MNLCEYFMKQTKKQTHVWFFRVSERGTITPRFLGIGGEYQIGQFSPELRELMVELIF